MNDHGQTSSGGWQTVGLLLLLVVALCSPWVDNSAAAAGERVVVVIDGSEYMRGDLEGASRFERVSEALRLQLRQFDGQLALGIAGYGTSRTAGCEAVRTIEPVGILAAKSLEEKLSQLKPKGSAPIAAALELAARELGIGDQPGTLVVIAGGADNCETDPCAVARLLGETGKVRIAVVAIEDDRTRPNRSLRCLAARTGGKFWLARNADELSQQVAAALQFAVTSKDVVEPQVEATEQAAASAATADTLDMAKSTSADWNTASLPENDLPAADAGDDQGVILGDGTAVLALSALVADQGPAIDKGLTWRIYQGSAGDAGQLRLVRTLHEAAPRLKLPAGEFFVNVTYGRAYLTDRLTIKDGDEINKQLVLNAGGLRIRAVLPDGEEIPVNAALCDIYSDDRDQLGNRSLIVSKARLGKVIRLNSGLYHLVSTYGDANATVRADISVEAGKLTEAIVQHHAARVTLKLVLQPGGEALADTRWSILADGGRIIKESAGALPSHILSPGTYIVEAIRDGQKYAGRFSVAEGDVKVVELATQ